MHCTLFLSLCPFVQISSRCFNYFRKRNCNPLPALVFANSSKVHMALSNDENVSGIDTSENIINWFHVYLYSVKSLAYQKSHCLKRRTIESKNIICKIRKGPKDKYLIFGAMIEISCLQWSETNRDLSKPFSSFHPCYSPNKEFYCARSKKKWKNIQIWYWRKKLKLWELFLWEKTFLRSFE